MKSVLLIGQSNMAGRGFLHEVKTICDERIFMLRNGRWQMMAEPIHFDRAVAGVGPAASFAEAWCNGNPGETIGLIPCAEGGSSLDEWSQDGILFRHAVCEAKFAMENSELIAILWHQGENDSHSGKYKEYYQKLAQMVKALRNELEAENIPFLIGGLGDYLGKTAFGANCTEYQQVNQELYRYAEENGACCYVTGKDLYANPDGIHMNAESQRRFGLRYYEAHRTGHHVEEPLPDERERVEALYKKEYTASEKRYLALEKFTSGKMSFEAVMKELM
ncbi:MAG: sialate O-acetylesterase [Lachnospiraceae bacterium]|nr:sialate O-acetylesterase [Lachnospiraceae bacterium]